MSAPRQTNDGRAGAVAATADGEMVRDAFLGGAGVAEDHPSAGHPARRQMQVVLQQADRSRPGRQAVANLREQISKSRESGHWQPGRERQAIKALSDDLAPRLDADALSTCRAELRTMWAEAETPPVPPWSTANRTGWHDRWAARPR